MARRRMFPTSRAGCCCMNSPRAMLSPDGHQGLGAIQPQPGVRHADQHARALSPCPCACRCRPRRSRGRSTKTRRPWKTSISNEKSLPRSDISGAKDAVLRGNSDGHEGPFAGPAAPCDAGGRRSARRWSGMTSSFTARRLRWYSGRLFFPKFDTTIGTLASFATFAVGFLARPFGGLFFGHFGDRWGRKPMLVATLLLVGGAPSPSACCRPMPRSASGRRSCCCCCAYARVSAPARNMAAR